MSRSNQYLADKLEALAGNASALGQYLLSTTAVPPKARAHAANTINGLIADLERLCDRLDPPNPENAQEHALLPQEAIQGARTGRRPG
jgi:hypothetical protein